MYSRAMPAAVIAMCVPLLYWLLAIVGVLPQPALIPAPPSVELTDPSGPASRLEDALVQLEGPLLPLDETVDVPRLLAVVEPDELEPP